MVHLWRRLRARLRYRRFDADLRRELEEHRAMSQAALEAAGLTPAEARRQAARALGNVTLARESARGVWIAPALESLWQDARYALRGLRSTPSFTLPTLAVLVITMGLTTSLFATIESLFFRPWPVPDAARVVSVVTTVHTDRATRWATGTIEYRHLRDNARTVELMAMTSMSLALGSPQAPPSTVRLVSGNYFSALRLPLAAGRPIGLADDEGGAANVAVIGYGFWLRQFAGSAATVGATLQIGGVPFTVIGVAGPGAGDSPRERVPDAWIPLTARRVLPGGEPSVRALLEDPRGCCVTIAGRLATGADARFADAEIKLVAAQFAKAHGLTPLQTSVSSTAFVHDPMAERTAGISLLLTLATVLMLVLGAANVANLQVARGMARHTDIAVRHALGASRGRLVRQMVTEGLVLSLAAAGLSLVVAHVLPALLLPATAPAVSLAPLTFVFAVALAGCVCLLSSLLPALRTTQASLRVRWVGIGRSRLRSVLLGVQVATSTILLAGTGLLVRGVYHAAGAGLGFDAAGVAAISLGVAADRSIPAEREQLARQAVEAMTRVGRGPVAAAQSAPFSGYRTSDVGRPDDDQRNRYRAVPQRITPDYFQVMGMPLIAGAPLTATSPPEAVVVNESLARVLWPGPPAVAVGRVFLDADREKHVVGVVADAHTELVERAWPAYYEATGPYNVLLVRNDPTTIAVAEDMIRTFAPTASPAVLDFTRVIHQQLETSVIGAAIAGSIALLALGLAGVGTLGVFSYVVNERTREIGVRMALGAKAHDIVRLLAARVSWPLAGGLLAGLAAAQASSRAIRGYLYGLSPHDPAAYAGVLIVLGTAALIATGLPIRRALRVDPAITLRHD